MNPYPFCELNHFTGVSGSQWASDRQSSHQSQNREGTRAHRAAVAAYHRRRGDRINASMSAYGTKRTCCDRVPMSALGGKADIPSTRRRAGRDVTDFRVSPVSWSERREKSPDQSAPALSAPSNQNRSVAARLHTRAFTRRQIG